MKSLTDRPEWMALSQHQQELANQHMRDWFAADPHRFEQFSLRGGDIFLDYSRNRIQKKTLSLLSDLAQSIDLYSKIENLWAGFPINHTEKRPALHMALRAKQPPSLVINGENIAEEIRKTRERLQDFVAAIHNKKWVGVTGKPIKHIVNLGIGGSHHGPLMTTQALKDFAISDLSFHFVSSVDKAILNDVFQKIDPETSLFIISSKSFTTIETFTNARTILDWLKEKWGEKVIQHHFIAVTAAKEKALQFGIPDAHIFPIWDWVGGRYSVWSAIGIPLMLMIGVKQFEEFLEGAYQMDQHFRQAKFAENMPVIMAFLSIWYNNFFNAHAHAIIPYSHRLRHLIPYIQQAEMESNGKSVAGSDHAIHYATGPIIFGEEGCDGQHTYHQLLHQGRHLIPADFILVGKASDDANDHHQDTLIASALSQAQALMRGKTYDEAYQELLAANCSPPEAKLLAHHKMIPGNRPSNILFLERMTPKNLGALLALYEHKIFVQGVVWDINSFDQWGVELGKQLLPQIVNGLQNPQALGQIDCATAGLIHLYKKVQGR